MATHVNTREAADYLHLAPRTLERWRLVNAGPPFRKLSGRAVRYNLDDLEAWAKAQEHRPEDAARG